MPFNVLLPYTEKLKETNSQTNMKILTIVKHVGLILVVPHTGEAISGIILMTKGGTELVSFKKVGDNR